ncbi:MAG TPA: hypothetical protein VM925_35815 [Labilithrix sp.]|jgi:hypothetical protein|nr:hypothetical protein [Labilithrix sp.]
MSTANLPNEPGAWDSDFSYGYLSKLYAVLRRDFIPTLVGDAGGVSSPEGAPRRVFVRHDIDVSLERAVPLARLEKASGIPSTYHVMLDSPFYDIRSASSRDALAEIARLGHEIGLHYDVVARGMREADTGTREGDIARACGELEALVGAPVRSLSFHLPVQELVNGPLRVAGRVSGYGKELFQWYISDSRARWREGEPLASLGRPRAPNLQILIHPIWWGDQHVHPTVRLRDFLVEVGPRLGGTYAELNDRLWDHIIYRAAPAGT